MVVERIIAKKFSVCVDARGCTGHIAFFLLGLGTGQHKKTGYLASQTGRDKQTKTIGLGVAVALDWYVHV